MGDLDSGVNVVGSIVSNHAPEHRHVYGVLSIKDCLGLALLDLFAIGLDKCLDCAINLVRAQEDQIAGLRVVRVIQLFLLFLAGFHFLLQRGDLLLVDLHLDPSCLEKLSYGFDGTVLVPALMFLETSRNFLREALGALADAVGRNVGFEVFADGTLPRL